MKVTAEEVAHSKLSLKSLEEASRSLKDNGFVILESIVDETICATLREQLRSDLSDLLKSKEEQTNFSSGHVQQEPPVFHPFVHREIVANPLVIQVIKRFLGSNPSLIFYSGNTNLPESQAQPIHTDFTHLWPDLDHAHPPARLIVNVVLEDVSEANGSTEIFPGSHKIVGYSNQIGSDCIIPDTFLHLAPASARATMKRGSVLIRDDRLWHRGVPNPSNEPRYMIAMIYIVPWMRQESVEFHESAEEVFEECGLDTHNLKFLPSMSQHEKWKARQ
eukprot:TRINITY_DN3299_c0_g1_i3.p1 TRINITY_DN3299_c0_g1~~TRINITY_DN3299_c0_g1_i3.p1  ORF type:complete len:276 (-),score=49.79 TRINITY_DN3299_c0_g1_i3:12-839(-)